MRNIRASLVLSFLVACSPYRSVGKIDKALDQEIASEANRGRLRALYLERAGAQSQTRDLLASNSALRDLALVDEYGVKDPSSLSTTTPDQIEAVRARITESIESTLSAPNASEDGASSIFYSIEAHYRALATKAAGQPQAARYESIAERAKELAAQCEERSARSRALTEERRRSQPSNAEVKRQREQTERDEAKRRAEGIDKHGACPHCSGLGKIRWDPVRGQNESDKSFHERVKQTQHLDNCPYCKGAGFKGPDYNPLGRPL